MKRIFSNAFIATATGLALRLFLVLQYPASSGDTIIYEQLAMNWVKKGAYAMNVNGAITPVDLRVPGYPAFLALAYALTGRTGEAARLPVVLGQVVVDLTTCFLIAGIAAILVPQGAGTRPRRQVFYAALWLAMLCPFTANYAAVPLTEVLAIFFTSAAMLFFCLLAVCVVSGPAAHGPAASVTGCSAMSENWMAGLGAAFAGVGTLFRPETPLVAVAAWAALAVVLMWRHEARRLVRLSIPMGVFLVLPLAPWALRNAMTLHEVEFLAPINSNLPGELVPRGFMTWEKTWLFRMRDCYLSPWKLNEEPIYVDDLPARAFDNAEEKQRVAGVLAPYNEELTLTAQEDAAFLQLARERNARHPLRSRVWLPAARAAIMWFTPRIELLPFSGKVFPLKQAWQEDPIDQTVTVGFFLLNVFYVTLGAWGAWLLWRGNAPTRAAMGFLAVFILMRTAFLTTLETPEPRYVLECFPAVLACGAQVLGRAQICSRKQISARLQGPRLD